MSIDRFMAKVKSQPVGCWEWMGTRGPNGYGNVRVGSLTDGTRRMVGAHRFAYEAFVGPIPEGYVVMHSCDNRGCVNPAHLSTGTQRDNLRDASAKGRMPGGKGGPRRGLPGATNPRAKLIARQVRDIRGLVAAGQSKLSVAQRFGISDTHVARIVRREVWP